MIKKEFVTLTLDELIPYENNPRKNEEAIPDTMESIRQCENLDPIEIDENNVILSGHTRLLALQKLGYTETEVIRYSGLTEEQKKKYRLLSNKVSEKSGWDFEKLEEELANMDFGGFDFGFDMNTDEEEFSDYFTAAPTNTEDRNNNQTSAEPQNNPVNEIPTFENYTEQESEQEEVNKQKQIQCPYCKMWFTL